MAAIEELVEQWLELVNAHDTAGLAGIYADDVEYLTPSISARTRAALLDDVRATFDAFPDEHIEVEAIAANGDVAFVEWVETGTHTGSFRRPGVEIPPTGKSFRLQGAFALTFEGDVIVSHREYWDSLALMAQLDWLQLVLGSGAPAVV